MYIYILFIITLQNVQNCQLGCRKCNELQNKCILCDNQKFYFDVNGVCQQKFIKNCQLSLEANVCFVCDKNYKPNQGKCKKIPEISRIQNCEFYNQKNECISCIDNYILKNQKCIKSIIPNCNKIIDDKCVQCQYGYLINNKCIEHQSKNNCQRFQLEDQNELLLNEIQWENLKLDQEFLIDLLKKMKIKNILKQGFITKEDIFPNCQKIDYLNKKCQECNDQFILDKNGICIQKQENFLKNCQHYYDEKNCYQCYDGFFKYENKCYKISHNKKIKGCLKYDQNSIICKECDFLYYLEQGQCIKRSFFDEFCVRYNIDKDSCIKCKTGYYFNKKCIEGIKNCQKHYYLNEQLKCSECLKQLAPNFQNDFCIKKLTIRNCISYKNYKICQKCKQGYFLQKNQCYQLTSTQIQNKPKKLKQFQKIIQFQDQCSPNKNNNMNCSIEQNNICIKCRPYFYLNNNQCEPGKIENCVIYKDKKCQKCSDNYILENEICRPLILLFQKNCQKSQNENCLQCKSQYFPFQFQNLKKHIHIEGFNSDIKQQKLLEQSLSQYYLQKDFFPNDKQIKLMEQFLINEEKKLLNSNIHSIQICSQYSYEDLFDEAKNCYIFDVEQKKCMKCKKGNLKNGFCDDCFYINYKNECFEPKQKMLQSQCQIYDSDTNCLVCKKNYNYQILTNQIQHFVEQTQQIEFPKKCDVKISEKFNTNNCLEVIEFENQICCKKCQNGFTGEIMNESGCQLCETPITNCIQNSKNKNGLSCNECNNGYILQISQKNNELKEQCIVNKNFQQNCLIIKNQICIQCQNNFFLEQNQCKELVNCENSNFTSECKKCIKGYVLNNDKQCIENQIEYCLKGKDSKNCLQCLNGYILYENNCFENPDKNCLHFDGHNCKQCKLENFQILKFSPNFKKSLCLKINDNNEILGCEIYQDQKTCKKCQKNWVLSNEENQSSCVSNFKYSKCLEIKKNNCIHCQQFYYPEEGICQKGKISHCIEYESQFKCKKCMNGFLLEEFNNQKVCVFQIDIENCIDLNFAEKNGIACKNCLQGYSIQRNYFDNEMIVNYELILNCQQYEGVKCKKCNKNFYLQKNMCIYRILQVKNCEKYKIYNEGCKLCELNYYLQNSMCVQISQKINHCQIYQNQKQCKICKKGYYLHNNTVCKEMFLEIPNCQIPQNQFLCQKCEEGFYLNEQKLCLLNPKNCLKFEIPNCLECIEEYYLKDKNCEKVEKKIDQCLLYDENQNCKECQENYILIKNTCKEINKETISQQNCLWCEKGYQLNKKGVCEKIKEENCELLENYSQKCMLCNTGYFMNTEKKCLNDIYKPKKTLLEKLMSQNFSQIIMEFQKDNYKVTQFSTPCLSHFSYLIQSGNECAIIDPLRDYQSYLDYINKQNLNLKYIIETHFHADFVSGHVALSENTRAKIIYGKNDSAKFTHTQVEDNQELQLGDIKLRFISTPGHTLESICIIIGEKNQEEFIFTGDTLFCGDAGRPDLASDSIKKISIRDLTDHLFDSLKKIKKMNKKCIIFPGHGSGSPCGKQIKSALSSTIENELQENYAMNIDNKDDFFKQMTFDQSPPPNYFFYNAKLNRQNNLEDINEIIDHVQRLQVPQFKEKMLQQIQVLDTRPMNEFKEGFIESSLNIPLDSQFAIWSATLLNFDQPILLVNDQEREEENINRLSRTGLHHIEGILEGGFQSWLDNGEKIQKVESINSDEIVQMIQEHKLQGQILDVRNVNEWTQGVVDGAVLLNMSKLNYDAESILQKNQKYYINCQGGVRSHMAYSLLKKKGFNVVNINGGYSGMLKNGLKLIKKIIPK